MEFNIKGVTFTLDELNEIQVSEIKTGLISRSHIIHLLPGKSRAVLLLRAGDFLDVDFQKKFLGKGVKTLYQLRVSTEEDLKKYRDKWQALKKVKTQNDQLIMRDDLIKDLAIDFWLREDKSFLNFVLSCFEEFYVYPPQIIKKFQEQSLLLQSRALLISSISCVTALVNGHTDYNFIKDLYNASFLMDYGLIEFGDFHFMLSRACEHERNEPGAGLQFLITNKRSEKEIQAFLKHPHMSYKAAMEYQKEFQNSEILSMIKTHHEKSDGSGFPEGYTYSAMGDAETILTFCDYLIPFSEHLFVKGDGHLILKDLLLNLKKIDGLEKIPVQKIIRSWESVFNWALRESEETG